MNTPTPTHYDVVVLGAGPVGITAAVCAHAEGLSVAVLERELVGGECNFWGCVPSKSLLRPVLAVADARRVDGAREAVVGVIDAKGVFGRRDRYVTNWHDETVAERCPPSLTRAPASGLQQREGVGRETAVDEPSHRDVYGIPLRDEQRTPRGA